MSGDLPELEQEVDVKNTVGGITTLNGYVYVVVCGDKFVRVFDANSMKWPWLRRLMVPNLSEKSWGLTSCPGFIFVSDFDKNLVYRLTEPEKV